MLSFFVCGNFTGEKELGLSDVQLGTCLMFIAYGTQKDARPTLHFIEQVV